jgi:aminoglycoside phosphotransferase (APT) family kinase protein
VSAAKMHADELDIDAVLVRRLLAAQFPKWAELPIALVASAGTDNAIYRLGDDMAVRLPRIHRANGQVQKEHEWLPRLAPLLPLAIPLPLAKGVPTDVYPWEWSVYRWLEGENATMERVADPLQAAAALGQFVAALQRIDPAGGPPPGAHNSLRGVPLAMRDQATRDAITALQGTLDTEAATAVGNRPSMQRRGRAQTSGCMEIFKPATCSPTRAASAPSSTSGVWAWAIPPAT